MFQNRRNKLYSKATEPAASQVGARDLVALERSKAIHGLGAVVEALSSRHKEARKLELKHRPICSTQPPYHHR